MHRIMDATAVYNRLLEAIDAAPVITRYVPLEMIKQTVLVC
jgi:hypothetical protein